MAILQAELAIHWVPRLSPSPGSILEATFVRMWELGASVHVLTNVATLEFLKMNWLKSFTALGSARKLNVDANGPSGLLI
jgi:hypothetical protein